MNNEEITALEEQLAEARAEIERLESSAADSEARAAHLQSELDSARDDLARVQDESRSRMAELTEQARASTERYRALALEQAPDVLDELVSGDSIEEIDASLERARETVARVREHIESGAQASRVPAGAPERGSPDLSALSPEEKIRTGLTRRG
jgi:chromosome segregation ATPase